MPTHYLILNAVQGSSWFLSLDLQSSYWQIEMDDADKTKTAFTTKSGLWEFNIMAFGLCNAPATCYIYEKRDTEK